jgi:succinate-semialdehyde dehydrogenase / glutarate-semialdehyde dehydrogenase
MAIFRDLHLRNPELMRDRAFVAGNWVEAPSADRITVTDPFDGSAIADLPSLGMDAVRNAIDIADERERHGLHALLESALWCSNGGTI